MAKPWTHGYLLIMLGLFPLWVGVSGYGDLTANKFGFFAAVTAVWLAGLLVKQEARIPRTPGSALTLCLMTGLCLSALCSPYGTETLLGPSRYDGLVTWLLYGGIFLGVSAHARPRLSYACALAFSGTVNSVVAVIQLLGYNCLWLFPNARTYYDSGVYYTGEFLGLIGNTDLLAAFFCLVIPVCFGTYVVFGGRKTAALLPSGALCLFVLLESGVAGGLAGLLVCVLVGAPLILTGRARLARGLWALSLAVLTAALSATVRFSETGAGIILCKLSLLLFGTACLLAFAGWFLHHAKIKLCKLPIAIALIETLCVLAGLWAVYFHPPASGTLHELSLLLHGQAADTFGSGRIAIWRDAWRLAGERPWLGGGPGTLELRTDLEFSRFVLESGRTLRVHVDNAHNEYLNLLVNGGLASLAPYLALLLSSLVRGWKRRRSGICCVVLLPLLAWWGEAFFGLGLCIILPMMWCALGLFWSE